MITLYVDAARDIKTGNSAAGAILLQNKQQRQIKSPIFHSQDNHEAEFKALIWALNQLTDKQSILHIYSDSQILIDALQKNYAKHYQSFVNDITTLLASYTLVINQWIPEKSNLGAHNLALQALKQK